MGPVMLILHILSHPQYLDVCNDELESCQCDCRIRSPLGVEFVRLCHLAARSYLFYAATVVLRERL